MKDGKIDIAELRLSPELNEEILGTEVRGPIEVTKPRKQVFFRTHPSAEYRIDTYLQWYEEDRIWFLPSPGMRSNLGDELSVVKIVTCIDLYGDLFLWPIKMPGTDGKTNTWNQSALAAADEGTKRWVRVIADMKRQKYRIFAGSGDLPDPEWPQQTFQDLISEAFSDYQITSEDHPVIKKLRGRK